MKVSELSGSLLDYWVAKALGDEFTSDDVQIGKAAAGARTPVFFYSGRGDLFRVGRNENCQWLPSVDWAVGGPIIDDNAIGFHPISDAEWIAEEHMTAHTGRGPTPLIAAMRAYVASKFGDEVPGEEGA